MNDRQRYAVGIAAAVLIHLFAAVMLGLFGVKYMEVPFRGEVLQVSLDAGGGNRGGGGSKGRKAPAAKSSEAEINAALDYLEIMGKGKRETGTALVRVTAAEPVPVKVTAMEAGREPAFLLRRRQ